MKAIRIEMKLLEYVSTSYWFTKAFLKPDKYILTIFKTVWLLFKII